MLPAAEIEALVQLVRGDARLQTCCRSAGQVVVRPDGAIPFQIDAFRKECLLNGWDDIGLTLRHAEKIKEFEAKTPCRTAVAVLLIEENHEDLCPAG